jgi:hypothetical protein
MADEKDVIHHFDPDGVSVLERRELQRENAILRERVEKLERLVASLLLKEKLTGDFLGGLDLPTRH